MPTIPPLLCFSAALVLLAGVWFVNFRLRQKTVRDLEAKTREIAAQKREIEKINRELEKRMLRAQINPHFFVQRPEFHPTFYNRQRQGFGASVFVQIFKIAPANTRTVGQYHRGAER